LVDAASAGSLPPLLPQLFFLHIMG
jgi:hypothetical protein